MPYVLSPRAKRDIASIWDYTKEHWSAAQAKTYIRQLQASLEKIAENPLSGLSCDYIRKGYYKYPSGSHIVFYRVRYADIEIIRILHERMDFGRHFT